MRESMERGARWPAPERAGPRLPAPGAADPGSAMQPRFNLFFRWFARRFFKHFKMDPAVLARLRECEARGAVVFVMRYASRLDYFLFNALLAREGLRLSACANGISFYYYQPLWGALRAGWQRLRRFRPGQRAPERARDRESLRRAAQAGESQFLFLRTARLSSRLRGRRAAMRRGSRELTLLAEAMAIAAAGRPVTLVPLALFWRKGPRAPRRFLNLTYGAATRPSDLAKVTSFLLTYRDLAIKAGDSIELGAFLEKHRDELAADAAQRGAEGFMQLGRKLRRGIMLFLLREERAVEGPRLRPRAKVQEAVLARLAVAPGRGPLAALRRWRRRVRARRIFREIAASMNATFLALLAALVGFGLRRLFTRVETRGLEQVAELAKRHPVVLAPSHRSYCDFLIVSWLLYQNFVIPPHIAARENMNFAVAGFLFRRAGAFFLRKNFGDALYKEVFRSYLGYLVREGFPQEFFIEGARSRTGKSLAPRAGILKWNIEAFVDSTRRDLYFVPVAISYERLVEESAVVSELEGARKRDESMLGLVRWLRRLLRLDLGTVVVNFAEPISLAAQLGSRRALFAPGAEESAEQRAFTERLGCEIVERINWAMAANATSVAAASLLGEPRRGLLRGELVARMAQLVELLELQGARLTRALAADRPDFGESIAFLLRVGLVQRESDARGELLFYEEADWRALDVYRNGILHYLAAPGWLAHCLLRGADDAELRGELGFWLDLFYEELFPRRGALRGAAPGPLLAHFQSSGAIRRDGARWLPTEAGLPRLRFLAEQPRNLLEIWSVALRGAADLDSPRSEAELEAQAEQQYRRAFLLGELRRAQGWNPPAWRGALAALVRRGLLAREGAGLYARGPEFGELAALRARLADALSGG